MKLANETHTARMSLIG